MADLGAPQSSPHPRCRSIAAKRSPTENSTPASHIQASAAFANLYLPCTFCVGDSALAENTWMLLGSKKCRKSEQVMLWSLSGGFVGPESSMPCKRCIPMLAPIFWSLGCTSIRKARYGGN